MKKLIISTILLFAVFAGKAQNEIYKTAQWRYYLKSYDFKEDWFVEMTYNKDTVLYGETWQQFKVFRKIEDWGGATPIYYNKTLYTHIQWNGNKVYYLPANNTNKYLLLDFDAQPGDSWEFAPYAPVTSSCPDTNMFYVDSVGTDQINGKPVNWIKGHHNPNSSILIDTLKIYQNIGLQTNLFAPLFNGSCVSDVIGQRLVCYQDTFIGTYTLEPILCNKYEVLSLEDYEQTDLEIFPNPSSGRVTLKFGNSEINTIDIYNSLGRKIF